eukprot:c45840_g1_i1.p1 GENE.c45840_g1_i1~~c45840_g1_i1.p1  ORF type:complete len:391 (-),score=62.64 c45840_g1_i1:43-1215(-)
MGGGADMTERHSVVEEWTGSVGVSIDAVRKAIPARCFVKSLSASLFWMARDFVVWATSAAIFKVILTLTLASSATQEMELWKIGLLVLASLAHTVVAGTAMWAVFVVGHDAGHGTFSTSWLMNGLAGLTCHSMLCVPFYPWALTHRRHHLKHNHLDEDYSFPWWVVSKPVGAAARAVLFEPAVRLVIPFFGWAAYLFGFSDGSHFVPLWWQRMWRTAPLAEAAKGLLSTFCCAGAMFGVWHIVCDSSLLQFGLLYAAPWFIFSYWLVTVTYLQHHHESSRVFDETSWRFVDASFETIDRSYGLGLDNFMHNITDCHVVHHLCFTEIPHYHLPEATAALRAHLEATGKGHLYRSVPTPDFATRIFKQLVKFGFWATLVTTKKNLEIRTKAE